MNRMLLQSAALALGLGMAMTASAQPSSNIAAPRTETQQTSRGSGLSETTIRPPRPSELKPVSPLMSYGVLVVLGGAILALSIMPSKRGHQD